MRGMLAAPGGVARPTKSNVRVSRRFHTPACAQNGPRVPTAEAKRVTVKVAHLPRRFHDAVVRWREHHFPEHVELGTRWQQCFPDVERPRLCAYREAGTCSGSACSGSGQHRVAATVRDLGDEQRSLLHGAIRTQASTELGSIQQHRSTLANAPTDADRMWVMRTMAEELRHGYQMLHLLVDDDWSAVTRATPADQVDELLAMETGDHLLAAFNITFDSFLDNVVFCALIDRVGKHQLAMQQSSVYLPLAESMPPMLREEAFHLASGVVPLRRWATEAGGREAEDASAITLQDLQRAIAKWYPRALEMFGDERGGERAVRLGLKPHNHIVAQTAYRREVEALIDDLNLRFLRARLARSSRRAVSRADVTSMLRSLRETGARIAGLTSADLLALPDPRFFRRRGVPAFEAIGFEGEVFTDADAYHLHLASRLPAAYLASEDYRAYRALLQSVLTGTSSAGAASRQARVLRRVASHCPCSRAVRWVDAESNPSPATSSATANTKNVDLRGSLPRSNRS